MVKRIARWVGSALSAALVAVMALVLVAPQGSVFHWDSRGMIDFAVYWRTGWRILQHVPVYSLNDHGMSFVYPPFAALLMVPISKIDNLPLVQMAWTAMNGVLLYHFCRRIGLRSWQAAALGSTLVFSSNPFRNSINLGQVNFICVALVLADLVPAKDRRRVIPAGVLIGLAAAIKLTPAIFILLLLLSGRVRAAINAIITFLVTVLLGFLFLPADSWKFWTVFVRGNTGQTSIVYMGNISVTGMYTRLAHMEATQAPFPAVALSAVVAVLGVIAGALWLRRGQAMLAMAVVGITSALAVPVGWGHHFLWFLFLLPVVASAAYPTALRVVAALASFLLSAEPQDVMHIGGMIEAHYTPYQDVLASAPTVAAILVVLLALLCGAIAPAPKQPFLVGTAPSYAGATAATAWQRGRERFRAARAERQATATASAPAADVAAPASAPVEAGAPDRVSAPSMPAQSGTTATPSGGATAAGATPAREPARPAD